MTFEQTMKPNIENLSTRKLTEMLGFVADSTISQFFPRSQLEQEKDKGTYFVAHSIRKAWSCAPAPIHSQHAMFPFPAKLESQFQNG